MRNAYTGFFAKQIMGTEALDDYLFQAMTSELANSFGALCGEAVLDPSGTGVGLGITISADTLNNRRLTITGDNQVVTDDGCMLTCGSDSTSRAYTSGAYTVATHAPAWFESIPYQNQNAVTYYVYVGQTAYPVDIGVARDGSRGYSVWTDAVGFTVTPNSITLDGSGNVVVKLDAALTALGMQHWLTANSSNSWSMACVVWLDTDQAGVEVQSDDGLVSIGFARMIKDTGTGAWKIDLSTTGIGDGKLGQAVASTTAADYKVAILGPLVTNSTTLKDSPSYVYVGSVLSGVSETVSTTGQAVTIPYASYAAGFSVEHNGLTGSADIGRHKQVTAEADSDLLLRVDSGSDKDVIVRNIGAGAAVLVIEDWAELPYIKQTYDLTVQFDSGADRNLTVVNIGAGKSTLTVGGDIIVDSAYGGTGSVSADGWFYSNSATIQYGIVDPVNMKVFGDATQSGTAALQYSGGGGTTVPFVYANAGIAGTVTFNVPISPPEAFVISELVVHYMMSASGTPALRVAIGRWTHGSTSIFQVVTWKSCTDVSGNFVTQTLSGFTATISGDVEDKYYLIVEITNNGAANDTCRVHTVAIGGTVYNLPGFQQ